MNSRELLLEAMREQTREEGNKLDLRDVDIRSVSFVPRQTGVVSVELVCDERRLPELLGNIRRLMDRPL